MIVFNLLRPSPAFTFPLMRESGPSSPSLLPRGEGGEPSVLRAASFTGELLK